MVAAYREEMQNEGYRIYVTDMLMYSARLIAGIGGAKPDLPRYYDILHPAPVERRTPDEVVQSIKTKLSKAGGKK